MLDDINIIHIFSNAPSPIMLVREDTSVVFVNSLFEKITGFSSAELVGQKIPYPWWRHEELREATTNFSRAIDNGTKIQEELFRAKDGRLFWVRIGISKLTINGQPEYIIFTWDDITSQKQAEEAVKKAHNELELRVRERTAELTATTNNLNKQIIERKKIEKKLKDSRKQLRALYIHLQSIREEERTILAREIHDQLGQDLTALNMELSWIYDNMPKGQEHLHRKYNALLERINSMIQDVKRISTELRPRLLDDLGIVDAIEWQTKKFQDNNPSKIKCDFHSNLGEINLNKEPSTAIFRIFQETLINVARHSKATMVKVLLQKINGNVVLTVKDNGIGITEEQIHAHESLGLLGIVERTRYLDGKIKIKGIPGRGTMVIVTIPINRGRKTE